MKNALEFVWIFQGVKASFPSAVFSNEESAIAWIEARKLSGILSKYPINVSVYDWAVDQGYFKVKREDQTTANFIQGFSSAYTGHIHFKDGKNLEDEIINGLVLD